MTKKVPEFKNDREAEDFLEQDLTDYMDLKNFSQVSFEFLLKDKKVNLRFPEPLLEAVKRRAKKEGISYAWLARGDAGAPAGVLIFISINGLQAVGKELVFC
jgi:predicted DNA binding CopG/RHH family protein